MEVPDWCHGVVRHAGQTTERPWPPTWEVDQVWFDCEHYLGGHRWEIVYLAQARPEYVIRCLTCHVPRCGDSNDADPCMSRRHHDSHHRPLSAVVPNLFDIEEVRRWLAT